MKKTLVNLLLIGTVFGSKEDLDVNGIQKFVRDNSDKDRFIGFCSSEINSCKKFYESFKSTSEGVDECYFGYVSITKEEMEGIKGIYSVESQPHIIFYQKESSEFSVYLGSLEPDEIKAVVKRVKDPPIQYESLNDLKNDEENRFSSEGLVLGVFSGENKKQEIFIRIAYANRLYFRFAQTFSSEIAEHFKVTNAIIIIRPPILVTDEEERYFIIKEIENIGIVGDTIFQNFYGKIA